MKLNAVGVTRVTTLIVLSTVIYAPGCSEQHTSVPQVVLDRLKEEFDYTSVSVKKADTATIVRVYHPSHANLAPVASANRARAILDIFLSESHFLPEELDVIVDIAWIWRSDLIASVHHNPFRFTRKADQNWTVIR